MILRCHKVQKSFVGECVLHDVDLLVNDREKVALVGNNGAGKSTLLKIITKELDPDQGDVILSADKKIGYLSQYQNIAGDQTIYEEVLESKASLVALEDKLQELEKQLEVTTGDQLNLVLEQYHKLQDKFQREGGLTYKSEVAGVLKGLGFETEDFSRTMKTLSGGQKTRVVLGKLLVEKPDLLLLDEPTNHLDLNSVRWLENYLLNYQGAVLVVSHDRYFLNRIVSKVVCIDGGVSESYQGNYDDYVVKKEAADLQKQRAYENQQREIQHQKEVIQKLKSFNREKSVKRAESREKVLDKIERIEKPVAKNEEIHFTIEPLVESGKDVLQVEELSKSFQQLLFEHISFQIKKGERVAILGDNGVGKTTILKIICNGLEADAGTITFGANVVVGYYDQEQQNFCEENTLFEEMSQTDITLTQTQIRNILAAFLFAGDDVYKKIKELSGGERGRLALAKLMLSKANFLILDEPTNHLDMKSKEVLEKVLNQYQGTVLFVSHDRYFINKTATRILDMEHHSITNYIGNYDYFLEKKEELLERKSTEASVEKKEATVTETKISWEEQKKIQASLRKKQNQLKKVEDEIEFLENEISLLNEECMKEEVARNSFELGNIHNKIQEMDEKLSRLYEEWEELSSD